MVSDEDKKPQRKNSVGHESLLDATASEQASFVVNNKSEPSVPFFEIDRTTVICGTKMEPSRAPI